MRRWFATLAALVFSVTAALAQQPVVGGTEGNQSGGTVGAGLGAYGSQVSVQDLNFSPFPAAGTIDKLYVSLATAPGVGNSRVYTLRKTGVDQTLTCTIADTATTCNDTTHSFSNSAGDVVLLRLDGTGSPTASPARWSVRFTPTTADQNVMLARYNLLGNSGTEYIVIPQQNTFGASATETATYSLVGTGAINAIYFSSEGSPGGATSYTFTLDKNSSAQTVTCSVTSTAKTCNDTAHSFSTTDGDAVDIKNVAAGSPGLIRAGFGYRFVPTAPGSFYFSGGYRATDHGSLANYIPVNGRTAQNTAEADALAVAPMAFYMTKIAIQTTDPSPGNRTFKLRVNGADTGLSCVVNSGSTTCSGTSGGGIALAAGDTFTISDTPAASANTGIPITLLVGQLNSPAVAYIIGDGLGLVK